MVKTNNITSLRTVKNGKGISVPPRHQSRAPHTVVFRLLCALVALLLAYSGWTVVEMGLSRLLSDYGRMVNSTDATELAARIEPHDAEAHDDAAYVLQNYRRLKEAIASYKQAIAWRPGDYYLWLELALALDENGDQASALKAFDEAEARAPFYAKPHWLRGNLLLRMGRRDEAFDEMHTAAVSNQELLGNFIGLAWSTLHDPALVEKVVKPRSGRDFYRLALFYAQHGAWNDSLRAFASAGTVSSEERDALITQFVTARRFHEAYQIWNAAHSRSGPPPGVQNGGFETEVGRNTSVFDWQLGPAGQSYKGSLDVTNPREGSRSLRIDFNGVSDPTVPVISETVLVEPDTRYKLSFSARTQDLLTGGLPYVAVVDVSSAPENVMANSSPLDTSTATWRDYALTFQTSKAIEAVRIVLRRQICPSPCPIFGHLWLDNFSLSKTG